MKKLINLKPEEQRADSPLKQIERYTIGPVENLSAAPTTAGGELPKHQDAGFYDSKLYINFYGTVYSFTGTSV